MDVRNCRNCGKMFNYISGPFICPVCRDAIEEKYKEVKKYIYDHQGVNIAMVAEACDVEPGLIRQWIREERLEFAEGSMELGCEQCGAPITSGRFCDKCKNAMVNNLNSAYGTPHAAAPTTQQTDRSGGPKMRFLN